MCACECVRGGDTLIGTWLRDKAKERESEGERERERENNEDKSQQHWRLA